MYISCERWGGWKQACEYASRSSMRATDLESLKPVESSPGSVTCFPSVCSSCLGEELQVQQYGDERSSKTLAGMRQADWITLPFLLKFSDHDRYLPLRFSPFMHAFRANHLSHSTSIMAHHRHHPSSLIMPSFTPHLKPTTIQLQLQLQLQLHANAIPTDHHPAPVIRAEHLEDSDNAPLTPYPATTPSQPPSPTSTSQTSSPPSSPPPRPPHSQTHTAD